MFIRLAAAAPEELTGFAKLWDQFRDAFLVNGRWQLYMKGLLKTLELAAGAVILGIVIGIVIALVKVSAQQSRDGGKHNWLLIIAEKICDLYLTVIRGTPVMLQLLIIYGGIFVSMTDGTLAGIVGFGINSGAYVAEIIRAGIQSIGKGQTEAGRSLGLTSGMTMRLIVMPQAVRNILPALFNEFITLLKETSVAGYIAVNEVVKMANGIKAKVFNIMPLIITAVIYLVLVIALTQVQKYMERRLRASDRR